MWYFDEIVDNLGLRFAKFPKLSRYSKIDPDGPYWWRIQLHYITSLNYIILFLVICDRSVLDIVKL